MVVASRAVTPAMRKIVLGGPGLADFTVPGGALGPYLKLALPGPGGRSVLRTYSVRRHVAERGELEVDVLLHGDGAGARFAAAARPGDALEIRGPGFIPAEPCGAYLLAGDHTALPAIAHILENLPAGVTARALVEVPERGEEQALASRASLDVDWLHRPAGRASRLAAAVREAWPTRADDLLVWTGAEAAIARDIRHEARHARAVHPGRCQILNYWKAGRPEGGFSYVD